MPADERAARAAAEPLPAPEDVYTADELMFLGGPEAAGQLIAQRHRLAAAEDRTAAALYDWPGTARRMANLAAEHPAPGLDSEQKVALGGARRHLLLSELAAADQSLRQLMANARDVGPVRLSALSGVSRRTVPGWIAASHAAESLVTTTVDLNSGVSQDRPGVEGAKDRGSD
ncbi:hypothetical protein OG858_47215 (plasmid) [Streptomyces europaeiscabiei]|uniref:hypothetical protein n=1 Tax=Streptomyces europaeiscabiei TaxID=146819 RepID=UPI002E801E9D|nr:hypothetical protein [Streptomyces europaeiscabiei]WUD38791.1 hypothetical protein OG858_47215 [Streptomyces europaeiscabiei]